MSGCAVAAGCSWTLRCVLTPFEGDMPFCNGSRQLPQVERDALEEQSWLRVVGERSADAPLRVGRGSTWGWGPRLALLICWICWCEAVWGKIMVWPSGQLAP